MVNKIAYQFLRWPSLSLFDYSVITSIILYWFRFQFCLIHCGVISSNFFFRFSRNVWCLIMSCEIWEWRGKFHQMEQQLRSEFVPQFEVRQLQIPLASRLISRRNCFHVVSVFRYCFLSFCHLIQFLFIHFVLCNIL